MPNKELIRRMVDEYVSEEAEKGRYLRGLGKGHDDLEDFALHVIGRYVAGDLTAEEYAATGSATFSEAQRAASVASDQHMRHPEISRADLSDAELTEMETLQARGEAEALGVWGRRKALDVCRDLAAVDVAEPDLAKLLDLVDRAREILGVDAPAPASTPLTCARCGKPRWIETRDVSPLLGVDWDRPVEMPVVACEGCLTVVVSGADLDRAGLAIAAEMLTKPTVLPREAAFARRQCGYTRLDLARRLRVPEEAVARWEGPDDSVTPEAIASLVALVRMRQGLCKGCGEELTLCPHCSGSDDIEGGRGQGGYSICLDEDCAERETCCGC